MRPQGSPAELERRRLRAIELLERDIPVHVVGDRLGVDRRSVRRWKRAYRQGGRSRLQARPIPGRPARLTARQRGGGRGTGRIAMITPEMTGTAPYLPGS